MIKGCFFFYLVSAILGVLFINSFNFFYLGLFIIFTLFVYKKISIQPVIIMAVCFLFFSFYRVNHPDNIPFSYSQFEVKVETAKDSYCIVKYDSHKVLLSTDTKYSKNDILTFNANITKITNDSALYGFEFKTYLNQQRVFYKFENVDRIVLKSHNPPLSNRIVNALLKNLKGDSYTFVSMLLFNNHDVDDLVYNDLKEINALHLFVVSGFHILFLHKLICFLFKFLLKDKANYVSFAFLIFYSYLLNFSISTFRAVFCLIFASFDKKNRFSSLDRLAISGLILLLFEPLTVYSLSFIMSYALTMTLILSSKIFKGQNKIVNLLLMSFICFLVMFPIQLSINYKINFFSFFSNILLSYVVMVLMILSIISLIFSFFKLSLFNQVYTSFFKSIHFLNNQFKPFIFGKPSLVFMVIFYVLCILILICLETKKYKKFYFSFAFLIISVFILYHKNRFIGYEQLTFLDVYQGDCAVVESKWGKGVMLIDTGGIKNYDIATKKIIPYLEYRGIKKIDLVVISHNDYDHCGALESLKENFLVLKVISNPDVKEINLGSLHLVNLNKHYNEYSDTNNKSIVLFGKIANSNCLFTGDIDSNLEKKIIKDYPTLSVDILKVAHHGSKYSTCDEFLEVIKPKMAIISVGKNFYGHPTKEVLSLLNKHKVKTYRTDIQGTIKISYLYFFYYINTAK